MLNWFGSTNTQKNSVDKYYTYYRQLYDKAIQIPDHEFVNSLYKLRYFNTYYSYPEILESLHKFLHSYVYDGKFHYKTVKHKFNIPNNIKLENDINQYYSDRYFNNDDGSMVLTLENIEDDIKTSWYIHLKAGEYKLVEWTEDKELPLKDDFITLYNEISDFINHPELKIGEANEN